MKNAFLFHGTGGHPKENWCPWLQKELKKIGRDLIIPQFPTPQNQTPEAWHEVFKIYEKHINADTIFIGHSLGGTFLLRVLEELKTPVKAAFLIAAPMGMRPIKFYETDKPFLEKPFEWEKIRSHAKKFFVFHSNNDPFVSFKNGQKIARELKVPLTVIKNAGHFNTSAGYIKFELLLEVIKNISTGA